MIKTRKKKKIDDKEKQNDFLLLSYKTYKIKKNVFVLFSS